MAVVILAYNMVTILNKHSSSEKFKTRRRYKTKEHEKRLLTRSSNLTKETGEQNARSAKELGLVFMGVRSGF